MRILNTKQEILEAINSREKSFMLNKELSKKLNLIIAIKNMGFLNLMMFKFCCFLLPFDSFNGCRCVDKIKTTQTCQPQSDKIFWFKKDTLLAADFFGFSLIKNILKDYNIEQNSNDEAILNLKTDS